ncbi:MAG: serine acetyltransferase [Deltaproteobacteria bacterium]|nr:serine acetyltransferase [Deltaproteobacteria bacterium]MBK8234479.1 serine acetyltransferase [Deltaproteobacteria bacterium]MBK8715214.1 serine acetyltransferase [Deltaproteobacteria bacterium]
MSDRLFAMESRQRDDAELDADSAEPDETPTSQWEEFRIDFAIHGRSVKNPAVWAMGVYRLGRWSLAQPRGPARWVSSKLYGALFAASRFLTGVHMDRTCTLGRGVHLIHCEAPISIHPRAVIGDRVGIMHNVTIGETPDGGVPTIGNDVFIGVGAVILGKVTVGDGAQIAANSLVISDVPPNHIAVGVPARVYPSIDTKRKPKPAVN